MFKGLCSVLTLVLLTMWLSLSPAFAGAGIPVKGYGYSSGLEAGTAQIIKSSPGLIYDISLTATASNALLTIYDTSASAGATTGNVGATIIYEISQATNGSSTVQNFSNPLATANGIVITVSNGNAFLNYQ